MEIISKRLRENLELFSFPRLSGTEHEKVAFNLAKGKIETLNLKPKIQSFKFSTFYSRTYPKISFPLIFWIFLTFYLNFNPFFLTTSLLIPLIIFFPFFLITRKPENITIGKKLDSQNLYTILNADTCYNPNEIYDIFFIAHLDSKGQRITARTRGISIFLLVLSILLNIAILLSREIFSMFYNLFTIMAIFPLITLFTAVLILSTNTTNNKSKGVVDDASGIVCVLELLYLFSHMDRSKSKCNLWFVFTGAEESGTMGIRFFYDLIKDLPRERTIIHNFESLGKSVNIVVSKNTLKLHPDYYNFIQRTAQERKYKIFVNPLTRGIHTDGIYLAQNDFSLFEYGSSEVGRFMHSETDSLENVDTKILGELCLFIKSSISAFYNTS
jgi:hypothetical protein